MRVGQREASMDERVAHGCVINRTPFRDCRRVSSTHG
jgi:hypothetical protein